MVRFALNEFGQSFATRGRGNELRQQLERLTMHGELATVDFAGVSNVSYSFADEFLGKLAQSDRLTVEIVNANDSVNRVVQRAIDRRSRPVPTF